MCTGNDDSCILDQYTFNEFDPDWVAPTLKIEGHDNRIVRKQHHSDEHGIVYCKHPMNAKNNYIEFLVDVPMEYVGSYGKIFVGLVD